MVRTAYARDRSSRSASGIASRCVHHDREVPNEPRLRTPRFGRWRLRAARKVEEVIHSQCRVDDTTPLVGLRALDAHGLYIEVEDGGASSSSPTLHWVRKDARPSPSNLAVPGGL